MDHAHRAPLPASSDVDPTTSELQAQIDRLSLMVQQNREPQGGFETMARLSQLTERCTEILNRWADTERRHAQAVGEVEVRLGEWANIEARLQREAVQRMRDLENTLERERDALQQSDEEAVTQIRKQLTAVAEICMTTSSVTLSGFERAESRLASLEATMQDRLTQLSRDLQAAIAEGGRSAPALAAPSTVTPFPLQGVMRIHEEMRQADAPEPDALEARSVGARPLEAMASDTMRQLPESAASLSGRIDSLERDVITERQEHESAETRVARLRRDWRVAIVAVGALLVVGAFFAVRWQQQINSRLDDAATRVAAAQRQVEDTSQAAARQIASTRAEAAGQVSAARDAARKADIVSSVLVAPDALRFSLIGNEGAAPATAQALFSRTRGLVLSVSNLPPAPNGQTYHVWLLANGAPVSAGAFSTDPAGRATMAVDPPPNVPRPMNGIAVTLEPEGTTSVPTGITVLSRGGQ